MLETTLDIYNSFLSAIKKESTSIVVPSAFNIIINEAYENWLRVKLKTPELVQKRIDDLSALRVVTDGQMPFNDPNSASGPVVLSPIGSSNGVFSYPLRERNISGEKYPLYFHLLNVMFKIQYIDNKCGNVGVSDFIGSKIMRSDQRVFIRGNKYRRPSDDRLYYEIIGDNIRCITDTGSYGVSMRLEYVKKPNKIFFDQQHQADAVNPNYVAGTGSVPPEVLDPQRQEIVDEAARIHLERVKDERYKSFLQEEMIKAQSK